MSMYVNAECTECRTAGLCLVVGEECFCEACLEYVEACPVDADLDDELCAEDDIDPEFDCDSDDVEDEIEWSEYDNFDRDFGGVYW